MTLRNRDILNLPDMKDVESKPPQYSVAEMIALCEQALPHWNAIRYSKAEPPFLGESFSLIQKSHNKSHSD